MSGRDVKQAVQLAVYSAHIWQQISARFKALALPSKPPYYTTGEHCSLWLPPTEVWEIRGADLTISPVHMSAVGRLHPTRGVSMRCAVTPHESVLSGTIHMVCCSLTYCLMMTCFQHLGALRL